MSQLLVDMNLNCFQPGPDLGKLVRGIVDCHQMSILHGVGRVVTGRSVALQVEGRRHDRSLTRQYLDYGIRDSQCSAATENGTSASQHDSSERI